MQENYPNTPEIIIFIWFVVSGVIEIISSFVLRWWLRQRGVRFLYGLEGVPGLIERAYVQWCRSQGQPVNKVLLAFRAISFINGIVAAIFFIAVVLSRE